MVYNTIILGILLVILGVGGYVVTGSQSVTALIPAFIGLPVMILGFVGSTEKWRKHAMHVALILALLAFLGSVSGIPKVFILLSGGDVARPAAVISQTIMAILSLIYLIMGIQSFIAARRKS